MSIKQSYGSVIRKNLFTIYCFSAPLSGIITVTTVPLSSRGVMVRLPLLSEILLDLI